MDWVDQTNERYQRELMGFSLDDELPLGHPVRMFEEVLRRLDLQPLEQNYSPGLGRPAIHPRVLAKVLLWGMMTRVRASRKLEVALQDHIPFRWLTGKLQIDHSTLSAFRKVRHQELRRYFTEVVLLGRDLGLVSFEEQAFDGTKTRANNQRHGSRTLAELQAEKAEIEKKFDEWEAAAQAEDARDKAASLFPTELSAESVKSQSPWPKELAKLENRQQAIDKALAEIQRATAAGEKVPERIPMTDPESRIMPNKEGGFAPNYTPVNLVDVKSGFIVECDVANTPSDDGLMLPMIAKVQQTFGPAAKPKKMLGDGAFSGGHNLHQLEAADIACYSPTETADPTNHPAQRADLSQPVSAEQLAKLPLQNRPHAKKLPEGARQEFTKAAFVFNKEADTYHCPQGKTLIAHKYDKYEYRSDKTQPPIIRRRYESNPIDCAECPLKKLCLPAKSQHRTVSRDQYEEVRERHATRMAQPESAELYKKRSHACETPNAFIKENLGLRQYLLRGRAGVKQEHLLAAIVHNVRRLMTYLGNLANSRAGPAAVVSPPPAASG